MTDFPTDDTTLELLAAACRINPDTGQTHLQAFLDFGTKVRSQTLISDDDDLVPVFEVEYEEGYEPWSQNAVILALIAEIQQLRRHLHAVVHWPFDVMSTAQKELRDIKEYARAALAATPEEHET